MHSELVSGRLVARRYPMPLASRRARPSRLLLVGLSRVDPNVIDASISDIPRQDARGRLCHLCRL